MICERKAEFMDRIYDIKIKKVIELSDVVETVTGTI